MRVVWLIAGCLLATLGAPRRAEAHSLGADCKINGGRVTLEAYYDDDTPARQAQVRVENAVGETVATGLTDNTGRWSFPVPVGGTYRIHVDAGAGHRKARELTVPMTELPVEQAAVAEPSERADFTRIQWPRLGLGLALIAGAGLVGWSLLRGRQPRPNL